MKIERYSFFGQAGRFVSETDLVRVETERDQLQRDLNARDEEVDRLKSQIRGPAMAETPEEEGARLRKEGVSLGKLTFHCSDACVPGVNSREGDNHSRLLNGFMGSTLAPNVSGNKS